jgi:hypothetical protein
MWGFGLSGLLVGGEAIPTINRAAGSGLERHHCFLAALGTDGWESAAAAHATAVTPVAGDPAIMTERFGPGAFRLGVADEIGITGGTPGGAAIETSHWNPKSPLLVKPLLVIRKRKRLLAVDADQQARFG